MKAMCLNIFFQTVALLLLLGLSTSAAAEPGGQARPACDPTKMSCTPDAQAKPCTSQSCLSDSAAQGQYEKQNDCAFPASACGSFNKKTQCCGKDPKTGEPRVIDKVMKEKGVISPGLGAFTWETYTAACPDKKQNNALPNELWQMCEKGKPHGGGYDIDEVRLNGTARPYCIDGCSIPDFVIAAAVALEIFLFHDRNNPAGYAASSFKPACNNHDVCYQTCKDTQLTCDVKLKNDSLAACRAIPSGHVTWVTKAIPGPVPAIPKPFLTRAACEKAANEMFKVLNEWGMGESAFNQRSQQYCQCC